MSDNFDFLNGADSSSSTPARTAPPVLGTASVLPTATLSSQSAPHHPRHLPPPHPSENLYQSPSAPTWSPPPFHVLDIPSLRSRKTATIFALVFQAATYLCCAISTWGQIDLLNQFRTPAKFANRAAAQGAALANDQRQLAFLGLMTVASIVASIFYLCWLYRASANAHSLRQQPLRFSPGWAVGWYFIPVIGIWMTYRSLQEIYQCSKSPEKPDRQAVHPLILLCWAMSVAAIGMMAAAVYMPNAAGGRDITLLIWADKLRIGMYVMSALNVALLCKVVADITWLQQQQAMNSGSSSLPIATAIESPL